MNCVKTLTNGRISLTKPLPFTSHASSLFTPHTQSTNQLISMLSAAVLPFQSTETPYSVLSRANFIFKSTETPDSVLSKTDFKGESTKPDDFVLSKPIIIY